MHWKCHNILSTFILQAKSMFHYKPYNFWFSTVGMGSKAAGRLHLQCTICTSTFSPPKITHWRARNSGLTWSMLAPMCPFIYFFFPSETLNEEIYWVCQSLLTCDASARWRTSDRRLNSDKTLLIRDGVLNMSALLVLVNHVLYTSVNQVMHL